MNDTTDEARTRAQAQFLWLNVLRLISLGLLLAGIAVTQDALNAPYWVGIVMVVIGMGGFFFGPPLLARRFTTHDKELRDPTEKP
ncbi:MAG: hypothetical protein ABJN35_02285 [Erythrobacter sp.]